MHPYDTLAELYCEGIKRCSIIKKKDSLLMRVPFDFNANLDGSNSNQQMRKHKFDKF